MARLDLTKLGWIAIGAVLLVAVALVARASSTTGTFTALGSDPPPRQGYFQTLPAGSWSRLPGDGACAQRVHPSAWEPRPENQRPNNYVPDRQQVRQAFTRRPRAVADTYDKRWDSWLLARVDGQHRGTTDENIQWAACKWGVSDNLLRAIAMRESTWYQSEVYPSGRCVEQYGCGDVFRSATGASRTYCAMLAAHGHDYRRDYRQGICPKTFSIVGVMSWEDPRWGPMQGNQNGTFPFNRDSTAFALDYLGGFLRGCMEGWAHWLGDGRRGASYGPGHLWGCVGVWYAGDWETAVAKAYAGEVRAALDDRTWLRPWCQDYQPPCSDLYGCPRGS